MAAIYTHRLTRHEAAMFVHPNPDIRRWWRGRFLEKVSEEAAAIGANAVWCVRLDTSTIGRGHARRGMAIAEVFAYGTALRVEPNQ